MYNYNIILKLSFERGKHIVLKEIRLFYTRYNIDIDILLFSLMNV